MKVELKTGDYPYDSKMYPNNHIICGGDPFNPMWPQYLVQYKREWGKYFSCIRQYIIDFNLLGTPGSAMNDRYFEFSDGIILAFTWRAWGDLMQAIIGKREGYVNYYW